MNPLTGALLEREALDPMLDVRCATLIEARELTVLDGECDALTEDARRLADAGVPLPPFRSLVTDISRLLHVDGELHKLQSAEDTGERRVVAFLDRTVIDLRRGERRNGHTKAPSAKEIGRRLRAPLHMITMCREATALDYARAGAAVEAACSGIARAQLLSSAVERELGRKNLAALRALLEPTKSEAAGEGGFAKTAEGAGSRAEA